MFVLMSPLWFQLCTFGTGGESVSLPAELLVYSPKGSKLDVLELKLQKKKKKSILQKQPLRGRMSLNKKLFVFHLFLMLAGTKAQGKDRAKFTFL